MSSLTWLLTCVMNQQVKSQLEKQQAKLVTSASAEAILSSDVSSEVFPKVSSVCSYPPILSFSLDPLNTVDSHSVSSWLQKRMSMIYQVLHLHCATLHDGSVGGHVKVRTSEVLIILQHGNNIINSVFYWYWHSKLTITHDNFISISILAHSKAWWPV